MTRIAHFSLACALLVFPATAADIGDVVEGRARVIDGDGLEVDGETIRLFGIDAVEGRQTCQRNGVDWACGEQSAGALNDLVRGNRVSCTVEDVDQYDRLVSTCRLPDGTDLNRAQVAAGWAVAYTDFSTRYVADEAAAKAAGSGVWSGTFILPKDWRVQQNAASSTPASAPPVGCVIKGNISQNSGNHIFHVPGQADYEATRIDESRGERWFCSEEEAIAAGWRKAAR